MGVGHCWLRELHLSLLQGDPPCSFPPWPRRAAGSDRFWARELRVSQHFSTFYGSSVQAMDTQLNALQTIAKPSWCTVHAPLKVQGSLVYVRRGNPRHIT